MVVSRRRTNQLLVVRTPSSFFLWSTEASSNPESRIIFRQASSLPSATSRINLLVFLRVSNPPFRTDTSCPSTSILSQSILSNLRKSVTRSSVSQEASIELLCFLGSSFHVGSNDDVAVSAPLAR